MKETPKKVLIVDDDLNIMKIMIKALKEYECRGAGSVAEAFRILEEGFVPRVALVDYMMPEVSGDEFIKRLPLSVCTPILVTAKKLTPAFVAKMLDNGALYVLGKPFSITELRAMVARAFKDTENSNG
jgi:DNA-binding NtrC family response regulator